MNKFKVGDEVQIIEGNCTKRWFDPTTQHITGVVMQVNDDDECDKYYVAVEGYKGIYEGGWFVFNDQHLMLIESNSQDKQSGVKYDSDKPEYSLLPKGVLNSVVKVLGFGSKKYSKDNWQKVSNPKERYYNAAQRHINQWWEGEKYDDETGENHLAHAICCLMFMLWFDNQEKKESK